MGTGPENTSAAGPPTWEEKGDLLYMLHELSRLMATWFDQAVHHLGVTHSQWWMLMHLHRHNGSTQSELAAICMMGRAAAGELIARMEERGLVFRINDEADARIKRVFASDAGLALLGSMDEETRRLYDIAFARVGNTEFHNARSAMAQMRLNMLDTLKP